MAGEPMVSLRRSTLTPLQLETLRAFFDRERFVHDLIARLRRAALPHTSTSE